jgi:hypothetical protein
MDRPNLAKTFADRPASFLIAMAIVAAFILILIYFLYFALTNQRRDHEDARMGATCTDWSYESPVEQHISGPELRQRCERYLSARSADESQRDAVVWQQKIDVADAKWSGRE